MPKNISNLLIKPYINGEEIILINHIKIKNLLSGKDYYLNGKNYIDLLNEFQIYFNFNRYKLLPNFYGDFKSITKLEDYNDIPKDIISGIKSEFYKDFNDISICAGLQIKRILKKTLLEIDKIIGEYFEKRKKKKKKF